MKNRSRLRQSPKVKLKGNSVVAAFEVECTTSVYYGLLRRSDLLALQSNLEINLYFVAPDERRDKVKQENLRPTSAQDCESWGSWEPCETDRSLPQTTATFTQWIGGSESKMHSHCSPPSRPIQSWPVVVPR